MGGAITLKTPAIPKPQIRMDNSVRKQPASGLRENGSILDVSGH
jgi:hypothetical protein